MTTAKTRYFSDIDGQTIELFGSWNMDNREFATKFPTIKGRRCDSFSRWVGETADREIMPVTRVVYFKRNPSLHKCDARCQHAKGHDCECSCGGENHGKGA